MCTLSPAKHAHLYIYYPPSTFDDAHTYTNSRDSNTCENSYVHAAPPPAFFLRPSIRICKSTILHVFLVTHIRIRIQAMAIHVRIAMLMLLWGGGAAPSPQPALPFFSKAKHAHLHTYCPSCLFGHTHTYLYKVR